MRGSVTVHMAASPERVWELVTDVRNTGRYSPETFEAEWLDGATAPAVGVRLRGHVRRNGRWPVYWTTCVITVCEPGGRFAFTVGEGDKALNTWRYVIEPTADGVDVTESFELADTAAIRLYWTILGWARGRTNARNMQTTLERVRAEAEAVSP